jgi:hypothetical protein
VCIAPVEDRPVCIRRGGQRTGKHRADLSNHIQPTGLVGWIERQRLNFISEHHKSICSGLLRELGKMHHCSRMGGHPGVEVGRLRMDCVKKIAVWVEIYVGKRGDCYLQSSCLQLLKERDDLGITRVRFCRRIGQIVRRSVVNSCAYDNLHVVCTKPLDLLDDRRYGRPAGMIVKIGISE